MAPDKGLKLINNSDNCGNFYIIIFRTSNPVDLPKTDKFYLNDNFSFSPDNKSPSEIAYGEDHNMKVIGQGALLRIVRIHTLNGKKVASEVFSGKLTKYLTDQETKSVGDEKYAIERYGPNNGKYVVLTFDDGPDPQFTPQVLNVLSQESAHSTFFPIGANIAKYPEIASRIVKEGHDIANHTFFHGDLDLVSHIRAEQEINQTQHVIRAVTGRNPILFRIPYGGSDDHSVIDDRKAILEAQKLGYAVATYDIDSHDWEFTSGKKAVLPEFQDGVNVVLMHDAGGDRSQSVEYLRALIKKAKAEGFEFTSFSRLINDAAFNQQISPTLMDRASLITAKATLVWPKKVLHGLFIFTMVLIFLSVIVGIILAELQTILFKPPKHRKGYNPLVTVIVPAFNEEKVLKKSVDFILKSKYRNIEVIIIDDGSKDDTWAIIKKLKRRKRVQGFHQKNAGKAVAVNNAIARSKGEILVSVDADTIFLPKTIGNMVRYFYYKDIGAVAGVIKVGNIRNWITRWQALEYVTSISIERSAQAFMRAITVVPGACSAWRKEAILKVGGYSSATLAEDCDLTLAVQKAGYHVVQDMESIAFTESPENIRGLAKQRFRWLFGNIQALWKHRDMFFKKRYGLLGIYVLPKSVVGILMQILLAPMLIFIAFSNILAGEHMTILFYFLISYAILIFTSVIALLFAHERFSYLTATPAFRLIYSPLRTSIIYVSIIAAIGGLHFGWNKVERSGSVPIIH